MAWTSKAAVAAAVAGGALVAGRVVGNRVRRSWGNHAAGRGRRGPEARWHVATVNLAPERVAPGGQVPRPLAELGDTIEARFRPAPGDRGTEIAVRLRGGEPTGVSGALARLRGADPRWPVRTALRETRSLLETGEVLRPSQPPTTERTLLNRPLGRVARHGRAEGLL